MKTSELTGSALDWAVEVAEEMTVSQREFQPSTNWSQGGPIIEREMANGMHLHGGTLCGAVYYCETLGGFGRESYGPTPLIAAMRCYVASKLGDEVNIPEELL